MRTQRARWASVAAVLFVTAANVTVARADVAPPPDRPEWRDHPAPMPPVPDEDEARSIARRAALPAAAIAACALAAWAASRARRGASEARP